MKKISMDEILAKMTEADPEAAKKVRSDVKVTGGRTIETPEQLFPIWQNLIRKYRADPESLSAEDWHEAARIRGLSVEKTHRLLQLSGIFGGKRTVDQHRELLALEDEADRRSKLPPRILKRPSVEAWAARLKEDAEDGYSRPPRPWESN
jgi:hypothetical protein